MSAAAANKAVFDAVDSEAGCRYLVDNQLATLPESFGDLEIGGDL